MKRFLITLTALVTLSTPALALSGAAGAADVFQACSGAAASSSACQDANGQQGNNANGNNNPIVDIISAAIKILSYIIGAAAIIGIVVSAIRLMTAGGDSQAAASARGGLIYSLIGIAIAILAQALVSYVLSKAP